MFEMQKTVVESFGVQAKKITKEKTYYIVETSEGMRVLRVMQEGAPRILFQHALKEFAAGNGFTKTDRFFPSLSGEPYTAANGEIYVLTEYIEGREANFETDLLQAAEALAHWHNCTCGVTVPDDAADITPPVFIDEINKQISQINQIKKKVRAQARLSDFDVMFIKHADAYAAQISEASEKLGKLNYTALQRQAQENNFICHNSLKEETVCINGTDVYITQYNEAARGVPLNDLCSLIRRYARLSADARVSVADVMEVYNKRRTISESDAEIIYSMLMYPAAFIKTVTQYYSKKRTWTPVALLNRMQSVISGKERYDAYIEKK